jgi:acyl carrier protein
VRPIHTIQEQVRQFIVSNFLFDVGGVADDASLIDEGIVDSTGVLGLIMFVEETFDIAVADEEVVPENFDSINALASYVNLKCGIHSVEAAG